MSETLQMLLTVGVPTLINMVTIFGSLVEIKNIFVKKLKRKEDELLEANNKLLKAYKDIAIMKTKIQSIEQYLLQIKEGR